MLLLSNFYHQIPDYMLRDIIPQWKGLSPQDSDKLIHARKQLHQATQLVSMAARSQLPEDPSDSHASLSWNPQTRELCTHEWTSGNHSFHATIAPGACEVRLYQNEEIIALHQPVQRFADAADWLRKSMTAAGLSTERLSTQLPYELPEGFGEDFRFEPVDSALLLELEAWYDNAYLIIKNFADQDERSSEIRCWPHHFDIATLIQLEDTVDSEEAQSLGLGLSPGDGSYAEPYFYITPWPYPQVKRSFLPKLGGNGHWHTDGWVGSVLPASALVSQENRKDQARQAYDFISSALEYNQALLA